MGGAAALKRATGARVCAGVEAAPFIRVADAEQIGLNWAKQFGFYPADYEWEPCDVDEELDGRLPDLGRQLRARAGRHAGPLHGPLLRPDGRHRPHVHVRVGLCLLGGAIILQNVKDSNLQEYAASCNKIAQLEWDALLPGHHLISLRNGRRHAEAAANEFNRIGLPRDLLR